MSSSGFGLCYLYSNKVSIKYNYDQTPSARRSFNRTAATLDEQLAFNEALLRLLVDNSKE